MQHPQLLDLTPFKQLIQERCGLRFDGTGEEKLKRALQERMQHLAMAVAHYRTVLRNEPQEFQNLVNLLTINETYFFREPEQIRLLTECLIPRLLGARAGLAPVRILSAGCSSGEEPFSLVMALAERYGSSLERLFTVVGGDIDSQALERARRGLYPEFSFRGVASEVRDRYFSRVPQGYQLRPKIREQVTFFGLNLFSGSFPEGLRDFDVVMFRNVSIYFDAPTRKAILEHLSSLLKDDGVLFVGTAETLANDLGVLPLVEEQGLFYFAKQARHDPLGATKPPSAADHPDSMSAVCPVTLPPAASPCAIPQRTEASLKQHPGDRTTSAFAASGLEQASHLTQERLYDAALPLLDQLLADDPRDMRALLLKAHIQINRQEFTAAETGAKQVLEAHPWSVEACYLLGLASKWRQRPTEAIRWFKQATYAYQQCWPAHYYLAELYRAQGDLEPARRCYRVVLQLTQVPAATGLTFIPLDLRPGEIRFLCEHRLAKLSDPAAPTMPPTSRAG